MEGGGGVFEAVSFVFSFLLVLCLKFWTSGGEVL